MKRIPMAFVGLALAAGTTLAVPGIVAPASAATACPQAHGTYVSATKNAAHQKTRVAKDKTALAKAKSVRTKAEKTLAAEKKHHQTKKATKQAKVVKADKTKVTNASRKLIHDEHVLSADNAKVKRSKAVWQECTKAASGGSTGSGSTGSGSTAPGGGATTPDLAAPLNQILAQLSALEGPNGPSADELVQALNSVATKFSQSGAPGADELASALGEVASAIKSGAQQVDPSQLATILGHLPDSLSPEAYTQALTTAAADIQAELTTPPTSARGLVDDIVSPIEAGLAAAQAPSALTTAIGTVQSGLDDALGNVPGFDALSALLGAGGGTTLPGLPGLPTVPLLPIL